MKLFLSVIHLLFVSYVWGTVFWSPPNLLLSDCENKRDFSLSINTDGDAVIGWVNTTHGTLEIAEYDFISDKIHRPDILYPCGFDAKLLKVILSEKKNTIFALWIDKEDGCVKASRYTIKQKTWSETVRLQDAGSIQNPVLNIDAQGNAMLMWEKFTGYEQQIQAIYFSSNTSKWSPMTTLSPIGYNCEGKKFSFDSQGNSVAVWKANLFSDQKQVSIQAVQFDAKTQKWSRALLFSDVMGEIAPASLDCVFDVDDNLVIIWSGADPTTESPLFQFVSYDTSEKTWGNKTLIETQEEISHPQLVSNHQDIYAIWLSSNGNKQYMKSLRLNYPGSYQPEKIDLPSSINIIADFKIKADHFGKINVICVDTKKIEITQLDGSWENNALFEDQHEAKNLQIDGDALGNSLVIWETENQLFYSRGDYLLPPASFSARIIEKRFAAKSALRTLLSWNSATSPSVTRYKIWKNGQIIAEIPSNQTQFLDKWFHHGENVYTICSINDDDLESQFSEFIVRS